MSAYQMSRIGISASLLTIDAGVLKGRERAFVGQDYVHAVARAGGVPVILPVINTDEIIAQQLKAVDGLILSGGFDVHPHFYGEEPHALLDVCYPDRDAFEIKLAQTASKMNIPILGICRGLQLLNVAFGGTLHQDIALHSNEVLQHHQKARPDMPAHTVNLELGTVLHHIFQQTSIRTNSLHHQSINKLAPGFTVSAKSQDGVIEGIESMEHSFILGVQWHPELMVEKDPLMQGLFQAFVQIANQRKIQ